MAAARGPDTRKRPQNTATGADGFVGLGHLAKVAPLSPLADAAPGTWRVHRVVGRVIRSGVLRKVKLILKFNLQT